MSEHARAPMDPEVLTVEQVSKLLGIGDRSVRRLIAEGHLPRLPGLRKHLVPRSAVSAYVRDAAGGARP